MAAGRLRSQLDVIHGLVFIMPHAVYQEARLACRSGRGREGTDPSGPVGGDADALLLQPQTSGSPTSGRPNAVLD